MPNIRIKDIPTTASATSSTDFIGIDGSANGTRKLNAYSPTFGGNLTVSGTGTSSVAGSFDVTGPIRHVGAGGGIVGIGSSSTVGIINSVGGGGLVIRGRSGTNNDVTISNSDGSVTLLSNLTVSNLITSAASSALVLRGDNATGGILTLNLSGTSTADFTQGNGRVVTTNTNSPEFRASRSSVIAALGVDATGGYVGTLTAATSLSLYANGTVAATLSATNGNLLIGTTSDGGQKLQVAGTAAITTSVASANIFFVKNTASNGYSTIQFEDNGGTARGYIGYGNSGTPLFTSQFYIGSPGSIALASGGNTTALTLDSSQNATFAGKATATRLIANSQWVAASAGTGALSATANAGVQLTGTGAVNDITLVNKNGDNVMVVPTGTTNATFAGSIAIGNTVAAAASVASTHKVTISIGGTTYYLLATNV